MGLAALILGGIGVAIVGACISFACDELSKEEQDRQNKMRREYDAYEQRKRQEYQDSRAYFERERRREERKYQDELRSYRERMLQRRKEENLGAFQQMQEILNLQYNEKKQLLEECKKIVQRCAKSIENQQHTYTRFNSMKATLLSLQEAGYKLEAYLRYLDDYRKNMGTLFQAEGELAEPFSMTLPPDYPYEGKVVFLEKSNFTPQKSRDGELYYQYNFETVGRINLGKAENALFENRSGCLPFMIEMAKNGRQYLSLSKGILKSSVGGTIGLDMEVIKVNPYNIWLRFANNTFMKVCIAKRDLNGRNRRTPIGSNLHVFVKDYDFALKGQITVSESAGDGMSIAQFDAVAMVQTSAENKELFKYLQDNNLLEELDEWRIGPQTDKDSGNLTGLILQKGSLYALQTSFQNLTENRLVLRYEGLLPKNEFISFDDVFVAANLTLDCYSPNRLLKDPDSYGQYFEECEKLRLYLTREFAVQRKILIRSPMSVYLDQWLEVTKRLIEYRAYGGHIRLKVDEWELGKIRQSGSYTILHVEETMRFRKFQDKEDRNGRNRFFLELPGENGRRYNCRVLSDDEEGYWLRVAGELTEKTLLEMEFTLDLYSVGNAYTERQQANAFRMFREGQVASEAIKMAIVDVSSYQYTDSEHRIVDLFNKNIQTNQAQIDAVTRAFSEERFFLIQGPPGTGKTTVIKELILQHLQINPDARIMVVSQANVAVDNVLRGIVKQNNWDAKIVRCGHKDRIANDMDVYSFDKKFETYYKKLQSEVLQDGKVLKLRKKWMQIMQDKDNTALVGECLLSCFQIIGATCMGLENRHYGLTGMEFDLVVIDEAGKALAGELLIPINRAKKVIIIGDHLQLPPVIDPALYKGGDVKYDDVVDQEYQDAFTTQSFFQRLYENCPEKSKCMLNIQFRMPPVIAELVSRFFYDDKLGTGENCFRKKAMFLNNHLIFLDMKDEVDYHEQQDHYDGSEKSGPYNEKELEAAATVIRKVREYYSGRIVIITPYKKQKKRLSKFLERESLDINVWVNTIDAFQGDEADVVLYCTTRSRQPTNYFSDKARLNVAFSRARNTLIFLGSSNYFKKYPEDHILRDVGKYLTDHAVVIPYAQWPETDMQYNADFSGKEEDSLNNKPFLPVQNIFFQTLTHEKPVVRTCLACKKALAENEDGLCAECIIKVDSRHKCQCCGKHILLPYYDKYLRGVSAPELCADCQHAQYEKTACSECGKNFYIQHNHQEELLRDYTKILCPSCEKFLNALVQVGICQHCGQKIELTRLEFRQLKQQKKFSPKFCFDCEKQSVQMVTIGNCRHCHRKIDITYAEKWYLEKKEWSPSEYCEACKPMLRQEILVGYCQECGDEIRMTYKRKWRFEEERKPIPVLCKDCLKKSQEKVTAGYCDVCFAAIKISRLKYDRRKVYNLCNDCRNDVFEKRVCTQCGEWFTITYGEKQSFERNKLSLPRRCINCRKSR